MRNDRVRLLSQRNFIAFIVVTNNTEKILLHSIILSTRYNCWYVDINMFTVLSENNFAFLICFYFELYNL